MGDDGLMRTQLLKLSDLCKSWASACGVPYKVDKKYTDAEKGVILSLLQLRFNAISENVVAKIFDGMTNCAELLLNATLTHLLWFGILNAPLDFLEHADTANGPAGVKEASKWVVELGDSSGDVALKLIYLSLGSLLESLRPTGTAEADGFVEKAARSKNKNIKDATFWKVEETMKRHCGCLLIEAPGKEAKKCDDKLWHIFRQAHDLSFKLWTQGFKTECCNTLAMPNPFRNGSNLIQAHLTMLIDDTDSSRDGQEVFLITRPYMKAYSNENGEFGDTIRVLNTATVCMATRGNFKQATLARLGGVEETEPFLR